MSDFYTKEQRAAYNKSYRLRKKRAASKIVPLEPTLWMLQAALDALRKDGDLVRVAYEYHVAEVVYKAMLDAVPLDVKA